MSLEQTKAFYQRIATDETFRTQFQEIESQEQFYHLAKTEGYDFTKQEFEDYTCQLLESENLDDEVKDLNEQELASVLGGFSGQIPRMLMYGLPRYRYLFI